ncbi:MAG: Transcription termination factor NusA [Parcubacteria group bacterium GW2011_GWA1_42_7]|nr:MAG: Transcription termination factor NusA [Parcubacteria group bacterium GW2011_GWA1_42_7]
MLDKQSFASAIDQICEEKGISKEKVMETIEVAIAAAYKKDFGRKGQNIRAKFDLETGNVRIFQVKQVLDESMIKSEEEIEAEKENAESVMPERIEGQEEDKRVRFNPEKHIMLEEAQKENPDIKMGEELLTELESKDNFGRIAAQTAKQVIIQRIREAERETIYDEFKTKEGEVVSGIVQRVERGMVFVDVGKTAGILFPEEQIPGEFYRIGQRLRILILEVQKDAKGPGIILSRANSKMLAKLFEMEVPEIASGAVEIKSIAREAGSRSKVAVNSTEEGVDPIGSCVGQKGTRVQAVINELGGEKIDIIEWSQDSAKFIANALAGWKIDVIGAQKVEEGREKAEEAKAEAQTEETKEEPAQVEKAEEKTETGEKEKGEPKASSAESSGPRYAEGSGEASEPKEEKPKKKKGRKKKEK